MLDTQIKMIFDQVMNAKIGQCAFGLSFHHYHPCHKRSLRNVCPAFTISFGGAQVNYFVLFCKENNTMENL